MKHLKLLENILTGLSIREIIGDVKINIGNITFDSRKVNEDSLFVAIKGSQTDGHLFIDKAVEAGARAILCEQLPEKPKRGVTFIKVADSAEALGLIATAFHDYPTNSIKLVGITGTNGKTTTATLLHQLFLKMGYKAGLLSTIENKIGSKILPAQYTTPDAVALNALLSEMVQAGCEYAFMEVSSHAIHQRRIAGLVFAGGVFTNLTHDHLDYHKTFREYLEAKKMFFDELPKEAFALTNIDDRNGLVMVQNTKAKVYRYSLRALTDFKAKIIENSLSGLHLEIDGKDFFTRLIGEFNACNLLAIYATAVLLGCDKLETLTSLSELKAAEGRFDYFRDEKKAVAAIVDYAHTPDAVEKLLNTVTKLRKGNERIITVIGCGGDRDRSKRPLMAKTACDYSDLVIFTADNPRSEDPEAIIAEMENGVPAYASHKTLSIQNRLQAIRTAVKMAQRGDIIVVAGKGHEKYQEIKGVKHPFDDKIILKEALAG